MLPTVLVVQLVLHGVHGLFGLRHLLHKVVVLAGVAEVLLEAVYELKQPAPAALHPRHQRLDVLGARVTISQQGLTLRLNSVKLPLPALHVPHQRVVVLGQLLEVEVLQGPISGELHLLLAADPGELPLSGLHKLQQRLQLVDPLPGKALHLLVGDIEAAEHVRVDGHLLRFDVPLGGVAALHLALKLPNRRLLLHKLLQPAGDRVDVLAEGERLEVGALLQTPLNAVVEELEEGILPDQLLLGLGAAQGGGPPIGQHLHDVLLKDALQRAVLLRQVIDLVRQLAHPVVATVGEHLQRAVHPLDALLLHRQVAGDVVNLVVVLQRVLLEDPTLLHADPLLQLVEIAITDVNLLHQPLREPFELLQAGQLLIQRVVSLLVGGDHLAPEGLNVRYVVLLLDFDVLPGQAPGHVQHVLVAASQPLLVVQLRWNGLRAEEAVLLAQLQHLRDGIGEGAVLQLGDDLPQPDQ